MSYNDFTEMPVWKAAINLIRIVYSLTETLPKDETYNLRSQIRKAATSINCNIAEGFGRIHSKDKNVYYTIARGSCFELRSLLYCTSAVNYLNEDQIRDAEEICRQIDHELNRIINKFRS